jgi:hypothetical protein
LTGTLAWLVLLIVRSRRFHQVARWARPAPADVVALAQDLASRFGLRRCPAIALVPGRISPLLAGFCQPRLFLPEQFWQRLSAEQQATLLAHELAHLRRQDRWVRALELVVTGFYWWHPVVWWARRELREAEEQCCDAWVVAALPQAARAYATALVETLDFLAESPMTLPAAASGIGPVHDLRRRLTMIMRGTTSRSLSAAGFLLVAALAAVLLPLVPGWAQQPAQPEAVPQVEDPLALDRKSEQPTHSDNVRMDRANLARAHGEVGRLSRQVRESKQQLERAILELRRAEERLAAAQDRYTAARTANVSPIPQPGDSSGRLDEMDRKLDAVLEELRSLRREMRRAGTSRGLPGGRPGAGLGGLPAAGPNLPPTPGLPGSGSGLPTAPGFPGTAPARAPAPPLGADAIPGLAPVAPAPVQPPPPASDIPDAVPAPASAPPAVHAPAPKPIER